MGYSSFIAIHSFLFFFFFFFSFFGTLLILFGYPAGIDKAQGNIMLGKRPKPPATISRSPHVASSIKSCRQQRNFTVHNNRLGSPQTHEESRSRLRKLNDRLPGFLRSYTTPLLGAPVTHVSSFLILHEITAILPLFGLVAAFHYGDFLPDLYSDGGGAFNEGVKRFGRWLRKKGRVDDVDVDIAAGEAVGGEDGFASTDTVAASNRRLHEGRGGARLVLEFASAYAITKALLPIRIAASVCATPWFARAILSPLGAKFRRLFGNNK